MTNTKSNKDKMIKSIIGNSILAGLLNAEFESGIFLERQKLISEFVNSLEHLPENIRVNELIQYWKEKLK